jgi:hypothetical protein
MEDVRRVAKKYGANPEFASYFKEDEQIHGSAAVITQKELDSLEDPKGFEKELNKLGILIAIPGTSTFEVLALPELKRLAVEDGNG